MLTLAPIILFVYNRPWHTEQTLKALSRNDLASVSELFIYADGAKPDSSLENKVKIQEVRKLIRSQPWCKTVTIIESDVNKGLAESIVTGVTEVIKKYGKAIVLEDDIVTSVGFLNFMNEGLDLYKDEDSVMDITGYCYPVKSKTPDFYFLPLASCWGWATWERAWRNFTANTNHLYSLLKTQNKWEQFLEIGSTNFESQLLNNLNGNLNTWAVKWQAVITLNDGLTIQPGKSLVKNIGLDSSGENCDYDEKLDVDNIVDYIPLYKLPKDEITPNVRLVKEVKKFFEPLSKAHPTIPQKKNNFVILLKYGLIDKVKHIIKQLIPPIISKLILKTKKGDLSHGSAVSQELEWKGNYTSWEDAVKISGSYSEGNILEKVKLATLKVHNGEAPYERDSVLFDKVLYSWPVVSILMKSAGENNNILSVTDFGGALGSHYYQNREFLKQLVSVNWNVIEQSNYVDEGRKTFENNKLKFYYSIGELPNKKQNVLLASSVLQYLPNPKDYIDLFIESNYDYIIFDRTSFIDGSEQTRLTVQTVPETIYQASYPCWFFNQDQFLKWFDKKYILISDFEPGIEPSIIFEDGVKGFWSGFIFMRKDYIPGPHA